MALPTVEALYGALEGFQLPVLYYGTNEAVERAKVIHFSGTTFGPQFVMFHPDDMELMRLKFGVFCRLVHLREWQPSAEEIDAAFQAVVAELEHKKE